MTSRYDPSAPTEPAWTDALVRVRLSIETSHYRYEVEHVVSEEALAVAVDPEYPIVHAVEAVAAEVLAEYRKQARRA